MAKTEPIRSEVWLIDFGLAAKVRPALVLSKPYKDEDRALIAVVPHTTSLRGSSLEVEVNPRFLRKKGAFLIQGFATVPPAYFIRRWGVLPESEMKMIEDAVREWLAL